MTFSRSDDDAMVHAVFVASNYDNNNNMDLKCNSNIRAVLLLQTDLQLFGGGSHQIACD